MSRHEQDLIDVLGDAGAMPKAAWHTMSKLEEGDRFEQLDDWSLLARDLTLSDWQRRAAFTVITRRALEYPVPMDKFLAALGLQREQFEDASMEQNVPIQAGQEDERLQMRLPFGAHLYLAVNPSGEVVDSAIFPEFSG